MPCGPGPRGGRLLRISSMRGLSQAACIVAGTSFARPPGRSVDAFCRRGTCEEEGLLLFATAAQGLRPLRREAQGEKTPPRAEVRNKSGRWRQK